MAECKNHKKYGRYDTFENKPVCDDCLTYGKKDSEIPKTILKKANNKETHEKNRESLFKYLRDNRDDEKYSNYDIGKGWAQCRNVAPLLGISKRETNDARMAVNKGRKTIIDTGTWEVIDNINNINNINKNTCDKPKNEEETRICEILNYYNKSDGYLGFKNKKKEPRDILETEIKRQFGVPSQIDGKIVYELPNLSDLTSDYDDIIGNNDSPLEKYKLAIHQKRGKYIADNWDKIKGIIHKGKSKSKRIGKPTKDKIIAEEIYDFWIELNVSRGGKKEPHGIDTMDFSSLFSSSNTEFEICMNAIFKNKIQSRMGDKYDIDIQEEINEIDNIIDLQQKHINYIEDKLKVISTIEFDDASQCMDILNICETMGNSSIADKMLKMAFLVFHIVGLDKKTLEGLDSLDKKQYDKLKSILDGLVPYTRRAVKNIIKISKEYELRTCGYNSTKTHILEVIYDDLFEKSKEVSIHFDATDVIPEYLIKDSSIMEFARAVILMVVAICAVYVLLMVLNRPIHPVPSK
tara:strand:- start:317 stop:1879 length:1563 start_codon:yes stop_codon:yes gene_type:complete